MRERAHVRVGARVRAGGWWSGEGREGVEWESGGRGGGDWTAWGVSARARRPEDVFTLVQDLLRLHYIRLSIYIIEYRIFFAGFSSKKGCA